jgi:hypothetical protein
VAQSFLGAKIHDPKDPGSDLSPMMVQVVSTLFHLMERHEKAWRGVSGSEPVPVFGFPYAVGLEPVPVKLDRLLSQYRQAAHDLPPVWEEFLSPASLAAIREAAHAPAVALGDEAWVRIVAEAAAGFRRRALPPATLIKSLVPLYLGKVATFVAETEAGTAEEAEARLEELALAYERGKGGLEALWGATP